MSDIAAGDRVDPGIAWLQRRLASPPVRAGLAKAAHLWNETVIHAVCRLPAGFQPGLWQTYALRGALGNILFRNAAGQSPPPFAALMRPVGIQIGRQHVPVPLLIETVCRDGALCVDIRLIGMAGIWRETVLEALVAALEGGMSIRENGPISRPFPVLDLSWSKLTGAMATAPARIHSVDITPVTPICYGAQDHDGGTPERFVLSALSRLRGMARWQGIDLALRVPTLPELCARVAVVCGERRPIESVVKHSRRHAGLAKVLRGERTRLAVFGLTRAEMDAVFLAASIGAGGHTSWGFGRYVASAGAHGPP